MLPEPRHIVSNFFIYSHMYKASVVYNLRKIQELYISAKWRYLRIILFIDIHNFKKKIRNMFVYKYPNKLNKDGLNYPNYFVSQHRFYMYNTN